MRWLVIALLVAGACSNDDGTGPEILQLNPTEAAPGVDVDVLGERFCGDSAVNADGSCAIPPAGAVNIGAGTLVVRGDALRWHDERITITLPADAAIGVTEVTVSVEGVVSNPVDFAVVP